MKIPTPDEDLDGIMRTAAGRRFIRALIKDGSHDGFSSDPLVLAYDAGARSVGNALNLRCQKVCARKWLLMMQEELALDEDTTQEPGYVEP